MSKIIVYEKPTCTTCRKLHALMKEADVDFDAVDYTIEPLSQKKIADLLSKMGISARDLLRTREPIYRKLKLSKSDLSEKELIALMSKHPELIQRPIVEKGERAVLARPVERVRTIL